MILEWKSWNANSKVRVTETPTLQLHKKQHGNHTVFGTRIFIILSLQILFFIILGLDYFGFNTELELNTGPGSKSWTETSRCNFEITGSNTETSEY